MHNEAGEFCSGVETLLERFFRQNNRVPPPAPALGDFAARLYALVVERGLPPPLAPAELGRAGGMSETETAPLVARVLARETDPLLAEGARQLVKACFYPEFKICRDSFREVSADGVCRRQQLTRVRGRVSGVHCVDCPHWVSLAAGPHAEFLASQWQGDVAVFRAQRDVFLPEDYRVLRRWLQAAARRPRGGPTPVRP